MHSISETSCKAEFSRLVFVSLLYMFGAIFLDGVSFAKLEPSNSFRNSSPFLNELKTVLMFNGELLIFEGTGRVAIFHLPYMLDSLEKVCESAPGTRSYPESGKALGSLA